MINVDAIQKEINELLAKILENQKAFEVPKIFVDNTSKMLEYGNYMGKRMRLISRNYQTGDATIEGQYVTGPYTLQVKLADLILENPNHGNKCSCGVDAIGGGKHSDYCDKFWEGL